MIFLLLMWFNYDLYIHATAAVRFANDSLVLHEGQNVTICVEIFSGQLLDQASVELQMVANPSMHTISK